MYKNHSQLTCFTKTLVHNQIWSHLQQYANPWNSVKFPQVANKLFFYQYIQHPICFKEKQNLKTKNKILYHSVDVLKSHYDFLWDVYLLTQNQRMICFELMVSSANETVSIVPFYIHLASAHLAPFCYAGHDNYKLVRVKPLSTLRMPAISNHSEIATYWNHSFDLRTSTNFEKCFLTPMKLDLILSGFRICLYN